MYVSVDQWGQYNYEACIGAPLQTQRSAYHWERIGTYQASTCGQGVNGFIWDDENRINNRRIVNALAVPAHYPAFNNPKAFILDAMNNLGSDGSCTRVMVFRRMCNAVFPVPESSFAYKAQTVLDGYTGVSTPLSGHKLAGYPRVCPRALENVTGVNNDAQNAFNWDANFTYTTNGWIVDNFGFDDLQDVFDLNSLSAGLAPAHRDVMVTYDECDMSQTPPQTTYRLNDVYSSHLFQGTGGTGWLNSDTMYVSYMGQHCHIAECMMWRRLLTTAERTSLAAYLSSKWGVVGLWSTRIGARVSDRGRTVTLIPEAPPARDNQTTIRRFRILSLRPPDLDREEYTHHHNACHRSW